MIRFTDYRYYTFLLVILLKLSNLAENLLKFSIRGGMIRIGYHAKSIDSTYLPALFSWSIRLKRGEKY